MIKTKEKITPVILGGDLGAYSMAVSFARACEIRSVVFSRERLAIVDNFEFIELHTVKNLDDCNVAVPILLDFAKEHKGEKLLLIPCADWYMEMLEYARDALCGHFYFYIPDFEIWKVLSDKSTFIEVLDKYGISHPKSLIFDEKLTNFEKRCYGLEPPFVLKPCDSSEYWRNPFCGMEKVYYIDSIDEGIRIAKKIYGSGYSGKIILQERIGGIKKAESSVLTVFLTPDKRAVRAILGDVLLEENTPSARGNYSAIVTRKLDTISKQLIKMLENIGYTGIANFDILYDTDSAYCLELNPRQGRSFDYIRCAGVELADLFIKVAMGETVEKRIDVKNGFWRSVSKKAVKKYSQNKALLKKASEYERQGLAISVYDYKKGRKAPHRIYEIIHNLRMNKRYSKYGKEAENAIK